MSKINPHCSQTTFHEGELLGSAPTEFMWKGREF